MNKRVNKGFGLGGHQCYEGNKRVVLEQPPLVTFGQRPHPAQGGQVDKQPTFLSSRPLISYRAPHWQNPQGRAWESVNVSNQVSSPGSGQYGEGWSSVWRVKQDTSHIEPRPSSRLKSFISSSLPTGSQDAPAAPWSLPLFPLPSYPQVWGTSHGSPKA